jgi:molybdenum cofactor cytidylyltransferase
VTPGDEHAAARAEDRLAVAAGDGPVAAAGLVLAAGEGRRFGGPKQLAELDGRPLIEHALAALTDLDCVVVVLGAHADEVRAGAELGGAEVVVCADWAEGMSASLRAGLEALAGAGEVVIALADQPFVGAAAVARVRSTPGPAARAVYHGEPGHPVVVRRPLLERAGELRGDAGFRDLLAGAAEVECSDLADPRDIDTRDDLEVVRR